MTRYRFLTIISAVMLVILCVSCGSENNKETIAEAPKITKEFIKENPNTARVVIAPPTLSLIDSPALNENNLVSFGFRSSKAGTISYSGSCTSSTRNAAEGDHHIRFVAMVEGTYDDCAIQVTDADGNTSEPLQVPTFSCGFYFTGTCSGRRFEN